MPTAFVSHPVLPDYQGEFNLYGTAMSFELTYERIVKSITAYNETRPHGSCDYMTPGKAHEQAAILNKRWKNYRPYFNTKQEDCIATAAGQLH